MDKTLDLLPGEGISRTVTSTRRRIRCDDCGEPAHYRHTYLLPHARENPASSGYHGDDISWCSDHEVFTCRDCKKPYVEGYDWSSTFPASERFAHLFLRWEEVKPK